LFVNGAALAIKFYEFALCAKEVMRLEQPNGKIAHAELKMGDAKMRKRAAELFSKK
jgi:PhnB protein